MRHIITFAFLLFCLSASAQKFEYLSGTYISGGFNTKTTVTIDIGNVSGWFKKNDVLTDSTGNTTFKSPAAALNFLGSQGWELVQINPMKSSGLSDVERVLFWMRRRVD